ncbi:VG15 protein [Streptomonospora wellingtoniae]|uniref:Phage head morphogenesis domain-containing protein n=1 Tax=Streptomonospora wellingtoniae TaxID=3075544 RepID=A0ABU2KUD9_9ACTN|nr:hypothetical protein [Streptomonospora sp. DSM 45055]MDT0302909.1 hypothetical protein [Streptomonospora sp. DSM 45055]
MTPEEFAAARRSLTDELIAALVELFQALGAWREPDMEAFRAQAVPAVQAGQRELGALAAAFMADQATQALGYGVAPPPIPDAALVGLRRGATPEEVYRRPFATIYAHLAGGEALTEAVERGQTRLEEVVEADLQQTYAHAVQAAMEALEVAEDDQPQFWRRVLMGEESCALCVIASTQRYRVEDLNPVHPGCDCEVRPLFGGDPGQVIDPDLLDRVHASVEELTGESDRGGRATDYRQLMVRMTREHGELGPMLVRPRDNFTSADDL